ncbi:MULTISPECIES: helix-turn-helix domain-containing protein [Stenotrophomonas]|uniref:helix-turn-helix domain-containing protein n=1 Tax=Stenotrophomonas TaxID=40323 RepID=UPI0013D99BB2|nr:excisionase family DNA-binding protein [Stenotrophomonas maltophilia]
MTVAEAAEQSACSAKTIRRAINTGQLTAVRLGSSARSDRIHPADLEDWWRRSQHSPSSTPPSSALACPHMPNADERLAALLDLKTPPSSRKGGSSLLREQKRSRLRKGTERQ